MKISELPTPRLRARAIELAKLDGFDDVSDDMELDGFFMWADSEERALFWLACYEGNWDKAKELQPSLFKPMDGKPHIKVHKYYGLIVENYKALSITPNLKQVYKYIQEVDPNEGHATIKEAVDALYSFKREDNI